MIHCLNDVAFSQYGKRGLARTFSVVVCYFKSNSPLGMFVKASNNNTKRTSTNDSDLIIKVSEPGPLTIIILFI